MARWRLTGNYGTFEIRKIVEAVRFEDAEAWTGIMVDLQAVGWEILSAPEGEDWTIERENDDGTWTEWEELDGLPDGQP